MKAQGDEGNAEEKLVTREIAGLTIGRSLIPLVFLLCGLPVEGEFLFWIDIQGFDGFLYDGWFDFTGVG